MEKLCNDGILKKKKNTTKLHLFKIIFILMLRDSFNVGGVSKIRNNLKYINEKTKNKTETSCYSLGDWCHKY